MRVAVIGGTGFIGRAMVADLEDAGHTVLVIHRGEHEVPGAGMSRSEHAHLDRHDGARLAAALDRFGPDALVDGIALTARDAESTLATLRGATRIVVLSSMDVYRAFAALHAGTESDPVPLDEWSPVRTMRYPYRGKIPKMDDYEKLDVEDRYLAHGATILRLPMVYGAHDPQRREEPVLRRIRAGRTRLPVGPGNWLWTRGYVNELARGVRLAVERPEAAGAIVNLGEATTATVRAWLDQIAEAAGATIELVTVPEDLLPPDLRLTAAIRQHLTFSPTRAQQLLGWTHADPRTTVPLSVRWHLANPPVSSEGDFSADDTALSAARPARNPLS